MINKTTIGDKKMNNDRTYLVTTQRWENYAFHDWNGEGECPNSWRAKGGITAVVKCHNFAQVERLMIWDNNGSKSDIIDGTINPTQDEINNSVEEWETVKYYTLKDDGVFLMTENAIVPDHYDRRIVEQFRCDLVDADGNTIAHYTSWKTDDGLNWDDWGKLKEHLSEMEVA
jgi:hypothetical protein